MVTLRRLNSNIGRRPCGTALPVERFRRDLSQPERRGTARGRPGSHPIGHRGHLSSSLPGITATAFGSCAPVPLPLR